jgi:hypothetical protein
MDVQVSTFIEGQSSTPGWRQHLAHHAPTGLHQQQPPAEAIPNVTHGVRRFEAVANAEDPLEELRFSLPKYLVGSEIHCSSNKSCGLTDSVHQRPLTIVPAVVWCNAC